MGSLISLIFLVLLIVSICGMVAFLPCIVFAILVETSGNAHYMYALTFLILSVVEWIIFIANDFGMELNIKDLLSSIKNVLKSIFKKNKDNDKDKTKNKKEKSSKKNIIVTIIEIAIIVGFAIFAVTYKYHSFILNLEYRNIIVKILAMSCLPLCVINSINFYKSGFAENIFSGIGEQLLTIFVTLFFGLAISSTFMLLVESQPQYAEIKSGFKSLFVYNNTSFDDIRKNSNYKTESELIENTIKEAIIEEKKDKDITSANDLSNIIGNSLATIKPYGYSIYNHKLDKYIAYVRITDKKTRNSIYYKIDYENNTIVKSNKDEYDNFLKD